MMIYIVTVSLPNVHGNLYLTRGTFENLFGIIPEYAEIGKDGIVDIDEQFVFDNKADIASYKMAVNNHRDNN